MVFKNTLCVTKYPLISNKFILLINFFLLCYQNIYNITVEHEILNIQRYLLMNHLLLKYGSGTNSSPRACSWSTYPYHTLDLPSVLKFFPKCLDYVRSYTLAFLTPSTTSRPCWFSTSDWRWYTFILLPVNKSVAGTPALHSHVRNGMLRQSIRSKVAAMLVFLRIVCYSRYFSPCWWSIQYFVISIYNNNRCFVFRSS